MITAEQIKDVNERVKKIEIRGKNYVCVAARVAAFREICPNGSIVSDIIDMSEGVITVRATVLDEAGKTLSTGHAQEKESANHINKTSYVEVAETSAVGRALGFLGIGSDEQIASAEEVVSAINNQGENTHVEEALISDGKVSPHQIEKLKETCEMNEMPEEAIYTIYGKRSIEELSTEEYADFFTRLKRKREINDEDAGQAHKD